MGEVAFWNIQSNVETYSEPTVPPCFVFIFNAFMEIYNACGESLTWTDIYSYAKIRDVQFRQFEITYILKCNTWANEQIKEMRDND